MCRPMGDAADGTWGPEKKKWKNSPHGYYGCLTIDNYIIIYRWFNYIYQKEP